MGILMLSANTGEGHNATARAIHRETGCAVFPLSMIMDGREPDTDDLSPIALYTQAMRHNVTTVINAFSGIGGVPPT